jgi:hypothetical protein
MGFATMNIFSTRTSTKRRHGLELEDIPNLIVYCDNLENYQDGIGME